MFVIIQRSQVHYNGIIGVFDNVILAKEWIDKNQHYNYQYEIIQCELNFPTKNIRYIEYDMCLNHCNRCNQPNNTLNQCDECKKHTCNNCIDIKSQKCFSCITKFEPTNQKVI